MCVSQKKCLKCKWFYCFRQKSIQKYLRRSRFDVIHYCRFLMMKAIPKWYQKNWQKNNSKYKLRLILHSNQQIIHPKNMNWMGIFYTELLEIMEHMIPSCIHRNFIQVIWSLVIINFHSPYLHNLICHQVFIIKVQMVNVYAKLGLK